MTTPFARSFKMATGSREPRSQENINHNIVPICATPPFAQWWFEQTAPMGSRFSPQTSPKDSVIDIGDDVSTKAVTHNSDQEQRDDKAEFEDLDLSDTSTTWSEEPRRRPKWQLGLFILALTALVVGVGLVLGIVINMIAALDKAANNIGGD